MAEMLHRNNSSRQGKLQRRDSRASHSRNGSISTEGQASLLGRKLSLSRSTSTRTGSISSSSNDGRESAEAYRNRLRKQRRDGGDSSSHRKIEDCETAEEYRNRLRKGRQEEREREAEVEVEAEAEIPGAGVRFGLSAVPTSGKGGAEVYVPDIKVNPNKINRDGRFAFNGEAWCMVDRVFAARNAPPREEILAAPKPDPAQEPERQVLVKWRMFPKPSWEPLENLKDTDALKDFADRHGDPKKNDGPADVYQRWYKY